MRVKLCSESFALAAASCTVLQQTIPCKSFPFNIFANPYPINPVVSSFYKILGGGGPDARSNL